jgi:hypothetical protein
MRRRFRRRSLVGEGVVLTEEMSRAGHRRAAAMTFGGIEQHGVGAGMGAGALG